MTIEKTLLQLLSHPAGPDRLGRARELGQLAYMQWLGGLPPRAPYPPEAARALKLAQPFEATGASVAEFCRLLRASVTTPLEPLDLALPRPRRRGGAGTRRLSL